MDPFRLSRGEYWLLESAVELCLPVPILMRPPLHLGLNKDHHGLTEGELVAAFRDLERRGFIFFELNDARMHDVSEDALVEILRSESPPPYPEGRVYYGLTPEGGSAWESFAAPDWDLFAVDESDYLEDGRSWHRIQCSNERRLEQCFRASRDNSTGFEPDSVERRTMEPWDATYWKRLPIGYEVTFRLQDGGTFLHSVAGWYQWG